MHNNFRLCPHRARERTDVKSVIFGLEEVVSKSSLRRGGAYSGLGPVLYSVRVNGRLGMDSLPGVSVEKAAASRS